jgi:hypothetical protein
MSPEAAHEIIGSKEVVPTWPPEPSSGLPETVPSAVSEQVEAAGDLEGLAAA